MRGADQRGDRDWAALSGVLSRLEPDPVTEFDLARLRRSVRQALPSPAVRRWGYSRWVASAAAGILGFATLALLLVGGGLDGGVSVAQAGPVRLARGEGGSVVFHFPDGKSSHRIVKSHTPHAEAAGEVKIAKGKKFVDQNGHTRPGEIVFYRID